LFDLDAAKEQLNDLSILRYTEEAGMRFDIYEFTKIIEHKKTNIVEEADYDTPLEPKTIYIFWSDELSPFIFIPHLTKPYLMGWDGLYLEAYSSHSDTWFGMEDFHRWRYPSPPIASGNMNVRWALEQLSDLWLPLDVVNSKWFRTYQAYAIKIKGVDDSNNIQVLNYAKKGGYVG